jgi:pimeloyl-ACP methyl ester carboxylesterase
MTLVRIVALVACVLSSLAAQASSPGALTIESPVVYDGGRLNVRVGVQTPKGRVIGDVLYFHGFADRLDNHGPLFDAWNRAGLRVIGFDLPSHGETTGADNNINHYSFEDLADVAATVEGATQEDPARPLILAGWSTGGLLATRIIQKGLLAGHGNRVPVGLILFAPGISVRPLVGFVTESTLTRNPNPPHHGSISPISPMVKIWFAGSLLANAVKASVEPLPTDFPVLTILGDDSADRYVKAADIRDWVVDQRQINDSEMFGIQCQGAYHELDNEDGFVGAPGPSVRAAAANFAANLANGAVGPVGPGICSAF